MAFRRQRLVEWAALVALLAGCCGGKYIITTPREWVQGGLAQMCVNVGEAAAPPGELIVSAYYSLWRGDKAHYTNEFFGPNVTISVPAGSVQFCKNIEVPTLSHEHRYNTYMTLWVRGQVAGDYLNYTQQVVMQDRAQKVFIQTDKYLYQPGQTVRLRMLTMHLTNTTISTRNYPEVWMQTPPGTRIAQWNDVDNSAGLVHLELTLADEPVQGTYTVFVKTEDGNTHSSHFKVQEYTLPRFEVTVTPAKSYTASDLFITPRICARYTYGQPVKGTLTLEVNNYRPGSCWKATNITGPINGCEEVQIELATMGVVDCGVDRLQMRAMVWEAGTEVLLQGLSDAKISRSAFTFKKVYQSSYKKPGLPYTIKVKLEKHDGSPAGNVPVEMCKGDACTNFTVPGDGIIVTNVGKERFANFRMKALHSRLMLWEADFQTQVKWYYSPSNSSLLIYTPDEELKCADGKLSTEYELPVFFVSDQTKAAITVQVISKRSIQFLKTQEFELIPGNLPLEPDELVEPLEESPLGTRRGMLNIPITLNNSISPSARVLVWLVRPDGEVVADVRDVKIQKCLPNKAELAWSETVAEPGQEVEIQVTSAPNSLCSLGVVDKSTVLLDTRPESLSLDSIFSPLESFYIPRWYSSQYDDHTHCRDQMGDVNDEERFRQYFTRYIDAMWMFSQSGLYVFSDLVLNTRPCEVTVYPTSLNNRVPTPDIKRKDSVAYSVASHPERFTGSQEEGEARTDFPETWLWDLHVLPESGTYSSHLTLPDTITEWVGQTVCVHLQKGLGLSRPTNITTFTPFFLDLTLPPSIKRGETLGVLISIFNYLNNTLPVIIEVHKSPEYEIIKDPSSQEPEGVLEACVAGNSKVVLEVKIKPVKLGHVNITVGASVDQKSGNNCGASAPQVTRRDALVKPITVKAEGFPREKTWNKYICADDLEDGSDSLGRWDVGTPEGIVEGSDRGWVTVVGSLLSVSLENLGHLIRMPSGCGEQNMINFAPNVFILQYLTITRQATPEVTSKLINHMNTGYQRQLLYLRSNGSYSAFGSADTTGSNWLTAFVVKSLAQAKPFLTIDPESLNKSKSWLVETQGQDGCFASIGQVFHKALKGGVDDGGVEALTSYVLVALLEAGERRISPVAVNATACLLSLPVPSKHPYNLALKAYALALVGTPEAKVVLGELMAQAVVAPNSTHWELPAGHSRSNSLAVETAGYAILAMLELNPEQYEQQVRKVVKWITAQRNGQGGFYSTQDTVVALQALAKYESTQYQGVMDFVATIKGNGIDHSFAVTENNKLVTQRAPLRTFPTSLSLTMVGNGCAVFQSVLRYNVHEPDPSDTFSLTVTTQTAADKTCTTKWINLCANYLLPDGRSNMAVIEVDLVSGYIPLKDDLKKVVKESPGVIKRYEVDGSKVLFYIEEFSAGQEVCLRMRVTRVVEVEGAKPGSVTVYDYYQPEFSVSKIYNLPLSTECVNA